MREGEQGHASGAGWGCGAVHRRLVWGVGDDADRSRGLGLGRRWGWGTSEGEQGASREERSSGMVLWGRLDGLRRGAVGR